MPWWLNYCVLLPSNARNQFLPDKIPESLNSAVRFPLSSGRSDNHSTHQKCNTYIVLQIEIFHKSCSRSAGCYWLLYKSTFLLADKNWLQDKTLPSPLHVRNFFLLTGFTKLFHMLNKNCGNRYHKNCRRECLVCFSIQTGIFFYSYYRSIRVFPLIELIRLKALFFPLESPKFYSRL